MRNTFPALTFALAIAGCAASTPVQPIANGSSAFEGAVFKGETTALEAPTPGSEQFRVYRQGATGFVPITSVRADVQKKAAEFCERKSRVYRGVKEQATVAPYILGNFPRVELTFECVAKPDTADGADSGKYERLAALKKLLDSGALTQAEFDREKAKLLSSP